ncbi:MAG TPA: ribosomal protein S18-alanine N-acetyltransferase [Clostridia bacterium]|nr:ribosomal protein S18-alanine N-acetyltransferase [Clostridia bacterium]
MRFERLKFEHLAQMAEIEKEAFDKPWTVNMFIPELASDDAHYLVGVESDEVVCYGGFHKIFDEGHIMNIAVKKEYRGQGLGRQLVSAMIARAKLLGINNVTLEVSAENPVALKLYDEYGFKSYGLRPKYYENGSDAVIMWKEI